MADQYAADLLKLIAQCAWPMASDHPWAAFADRLTTLAEQKSLPARGEGGGQAGPEMARLKERFFPADPSKPHIKNFHVTWGDDAHLRTPEQRAKAINDALDTATEAPQDAGPSPHPVLLSVLQCLVCGGYDQHKRHCPVIHSSAKAEGDGRQEAERRSSDSASGSVATPRHTANEKVVAGQLTGPSPTSPAPPAPGTEDGGASARTGDHIVPIIHNGDHAEFEREHANTPPKERPDWPLPSFDARDWAEAFCKRVRGGLDAGDEAWLTTWFAAALMRGFDEHRTRYGKQEQRVAEIDEAAEKIGFIIGNGPLTYEHARDINLLLSRIKGVPPGPPVPPKHAGGDHAKS